MSNRGHPWCEQVAAKSMEDLEVLRGTLQFKDGLPMFCTPRATMAAAPSA
jgi:hypothetical protein